MNPDQNPTPVSWISRPPARARESGSAAARSGPGSMIRWNDRSPKTKDKESRKVKERRSNPNTSKFCWLQSSLISRD